MLEIVMRWHGDKKTYEKVRNTMVPPCDERDLMTCGEYKMLIFFCVLMFGRNAVATRDL